ncbi:hypothetical protein GCM10022383_29120 [Microbacterium soli]|uniref:Sensor histidine kinase n=2 Tax=Microbacterium soli TaxID=446075 RepID=A0ABP7NLA5_9MICO
MANLARDMRLAWRLLTDWERWALIGAPLALISAYTLYQLSDALGVVWFVLIGLFVGIVGGALLQRLAAVRGRLSLCADQATRTFGGSSLSIRSPGAV